MTVLTRDEWLEVRRHHLGASDIAAILGEDPRRGPLAVYESKVTGYSQEDNDWLAYGRDVEGAIANMYSRKADVDVYDLGATHIVYHPDYPWIGATLDRKTARGPLELKNIGDPSVKPKKWGANPLMHQLIQLQTQIACCDDERGTLAAMFPGYQMRWVDVERDDELMSEAYPIVGDFWTNNVIAKVPPEPDDLPGTLDICKRLWSKDDGETIALDDEAMMLAAALGHEKGMEKAAKKAKKHIESKIRAKMQNATFGVLPDGTFLSLKTVENKGGSYVTKPYKYRTLRRVKQRG